MLYCKVLGCSTVVKHKTKCKKHWLQIKKFGRPVKTAFDPRPAVRCKGYSKLPLGLDGYNGFAIIDKEFEYLDRYKWNVSDTGYARALIDGKWVKLHRVVMGAKKGEIVDHISRDRLDNRTANLRICSPSQNNYNRLAQSNNTTGYKGVYPRNGRYCAKINKQYKQFHLGTFDTPEEAAIAYNNGALLHFGEFAKLNKVKGA